MNNVCEWVLPEKPMKLICLGPEYMGITIASAALRLKNDIAHLQVCNWGEIIDLNTCLAPGMRISFLSQLERDPKLQRKLKAQSQLKVVDCVS